MQDVHFRSDRHSPLSRFAARGGGVQGRDGCQGKFPSSASTLKISTDHLQGAQIYGMTSRGPVEVNIAVQTDTSVNLSVSS